MIVGAKIGLHTLSRLIGLWRVRRAVHIASSGVKMLPDLRSVKFDLQLVHMDMISKLSRKLTGILSVIPRHVINEGGSMRTLRADGSEEESSMNSVQAELVIDINSVPTMTPDQRYSHLEKLASDMAQGMSRRLYESLGDSLDKAGQTVSADGKGFSPELILQLLEKMELDFDGNGEIKNLCITLAPSQREQFITAQRLLQTDPVLRAKHEKLIAKKKESWRDREASRKLVG